MAITINDFPKCIFNPGIACEIAKAHNVSIIDIAVANKLWDINRSYAGQTLKIPDSYDFFYNNEISKKSTFDNFNCLCNINKSLSDIIFVQKF